MLTPHLIARIFDRSVAARLRSSVDAVEPKGLLHSSGINVSGLHAKIFTDWLAGYWLPDGPTEPLRYPDAVSFWAPIQWSAVHLVRRGIRHPGISLKLAVRLLSDSDHGRPPRCQG